MNTDQKMKRMDMIAPGGAYTANCDLAVSAGFRDQVPAEEKKNISDGYPYGRHANPDAPVSLYHLFENHADIIPAGSTFKVKQVVYHAKATLKDGKTLEGAYQCVLAEFEENGVQKEGYIWTVCNGQEADIVPEGLSLLIDERGLASFEAAFQKNHDGSYSLKNFAFFVEIKDGTLEFHIIDPAGAPLSWATMILTGFDGTFQKIIPIIDGQGKLTQLPQGTYLLQKIE